MEDNLEQMALKASWITIIINILLSLLKIITGIFAHSMAIFSDGIHSLSDVFSTLIVIAGLKIAHKKADKEHPYGHERFESVAALLVAIFLGATGLAIGFRGLSTIFTKDYNTLIRPGISALIAAAISIIFKEGMYRYKKAVAKKVNSDALLADAWHHRSDAFSSLGSLAGVIGARKGYPIFDPLAGLLISAFILKVAVDIFKDSLNKIVDRACDEETIDQIRQLILAQRGVEGIDVLKTRLFGNKIFIDLEISICSTNTLQVSHEIAHTIHDVLDEQIPNLKHCTVHFNPKYPKNYSKYN